MNVTKVLGGIEKVLRRSRAWKETKGGKLVSFQGEQSSKLVPKLTEKTE